jgi:hypothetical protein
MYTNYQELRLNPETCNFTNSHKKWEIDDDKLLIKLLNENKSYEEIARILKRTEGGIKARVIDKILVPKYNNGNFNKLAEKYKFNDILYLERIIKQRIAREKRSKENSRITKKLFENETKEDYDIRMQEIKEKNQIKKAGGEKYYELLLNIVERLERIEKKIDGYDFT